ncbi:FAD-binding oxidoreductase [Corynebacterium bovis]|uniref:FAD-binding oxidoreductase n=4 Tax=Corynebacterium bovis TaxID=36808 RepID=A0A426Q3V3_9CORY|nr:FAD-binding oxidoreductase [Corynebacterium bovis]RRO92050.1 FAD-binding oxidoreductase [Corynebacterium bovis]RRQ00260.1 FAD-binding oxidoreductase [Corynebacterium bovis]RRQ03388.1 FAD-binding oxidoreductase [Corynebacterium bovis]RRQ07648.1 FAD-binding oxidoreductase [Corynebacterium bovis]RRQ09729.1 FAD-binding oxidoreductase [Corynebacterium bovis]
MSTAETTPATRDDLLRALTDALSPGAVVTDPDIVEGYRRDRTMDPGAGTPLAVVRARDEDDVRAVMRFATAHHVPVVPRGAGSSVVGGSTAVEGAVTLSLEAMDGIAVDAAAMTVTAGPGAVTGAVRAAAAAEGLAYPPDPTSADFCSVGGNVATNAGGPSGTASGSTARHVVALRVVLADGTVLVLGGPSRKASAGVPLLDLFIGSEGTLGVVTEVTLRLLPAPAPQHTVAAFFTDVDDAAAAAADIAHRLLPSDLVILDRTALEVAEQAVPMGLEESTQAVLYATSEESGAALMARICGDHGAADVFTTDDARQAEAVSRPRSAMYEALEGRYAMIVEDVVVPLPAVGAYLGTVRRVAADAGQQVLTYAYAAEGVVHPVIPFDPTDGASAGRAAGVAATLRAEAAALGGAVAGEYGVGADKRDAVADLVGPAVAEVQRRVKAALDPDGLLNPRVLVGD